MEDLLLEYDVSADPEIVKLSPSGPFLYPLLLIQDQVLQKIAHGDGETDHSGLMVFQVLMVRFNCIFEIE